MSTQGAEYSITYYKQISYVTSSVLQPIIMKVGLKMGGNNEKPKACAKEVPMQAKNDDVVIESTELFQGRRVVHISHRGERYRLIETRNGKLILQK